MSTQTTSIAWTDRTWNPVRGCSVISPGCVNCYAMKLAHRFSGPGQPYEGLTKQTKSGPQWTGKIRTVEYSALLEPLRWRQPQRVFVNSMSDLFHDGIDDDTIASVFAVMALAHWHTFQVLTKRARRMRDLLNDPDFRGLVDAWINVILDDEDRPRSLRYDALNRTTTDARATAPDVEGADWPLPNVWLGVSAEDQPRADERIPDLKRTPAAVRFISAEPLLSGLLGLSQWISAGADSREMWTKYCPLDAAGLAIIPGIDWVIVGGESGLHARACNLRWIRSVLRQCRDAGVAVFVKQLGSRPFDRDESVDARPTVMYLRDGKGADPREWPEDLRVQEFPTTAVAA